MKRAEITSAQAYKLVGKSVAKSLGQGMVRELLLATGAKLTRCGRQYVVHGYASDGSDVDNALLAATKQFVRCAAHGGQALACPGKVCEHWTSDGRKCIELECPDYPRGYEEATHL